MPKLTARIFLAMLLMFATKGFPEKITGFDLLSFERQKCYGACPRYWLDIRPDGSLQYLGKGNVKTIGVVKTKLTAEQIEKLIAAINEINFFDLRDKYPSEKDDCDVVTDQSTVVIRIRIGDRDKTVTHYLGCFEDNKTRRVYPTDLAEFEDKIDKIVETSKWTGKD